MRGILILLCTVLLLAESVFCTDINNGEDITRPLSRVDFRTEVQSGSNFPGGDDLTVTLRFEKKIDLQCNYQASLRADLPYEWFACEKKCCPKGYKSKNAPGDTLTQGFLIFPPGKKWTYAAGLQMIFPTAGDNLQIGQGKYQCLPSLAAKYDLSEWIKEAYVGVLFRYAFDVAGYSSAPHVSQLYVQPFWNFNLPGDLFLSFAPEIRYNWMDRGWFVPFDMMLGWMAHPRVVFSLEYQDAIVYDYRRYQQSLELRMGWFY